MTSKWLAVLVMGFLSLALASLLDVLAVGQTMNGLPSLWASWAVSLALTGFVAARATSARTAWGLLSLINGGISGAIFLADTVLSATSAPYEPGADWLRSVDLTPPVVARLREAIAAGYFAIAVLIAGMIFLAAAYFLLRLRHHSNRHAH